MQIKRGYLIVYPLALSIVPAPCNIADDRDYGCRPIQYAGALARSDARTVWSRIRSSRPATSIRRDFGHELKFYSHSPPTTDTSRAIEVFSYKTSPPL